MSRRALVSQTRVPEVDRDAGSRRVGRFIDWLLADGWSVTFMASEKNVDLHHVRRLRQQGVATYIGFEDAEAVVSSGGFELALLSFWQPASELLPVVRGLSPETRVVVDSQDLHFLRDARRLLASGAVLDERYGQRLAEELNTYRAADAVLTVSDKESGLLAELMGPERIFSIPLVESLERSSVPFEERRGIFYVGNFRHLPNGEAVEYLCREVLPRLDPDLLAAHPLTVAGSRLDEKVRDHARGLANVNMVGWVPSVVPYLQQARVCAMPMLHGAGVKGKIVQALANGTPVVTTPVGAEGMPLRHREHALIADSPGDLAAGLALLLSDSGEWQRLADAGYDLAAHEYAPERAQELFADVIEMVLELPVREGGGPAGANRMRRRELAYRQTVQSVAETLERVTDPAATVLVVSRGDDALVELSGRTGAHFPQAPDGRWAGYHPADSETAIRHLESLRLRGARYLAVPSSAFWWLHHYRDFATHLDKRYRRIHSGEHLVLFDIGEEARRAAPAPAGFRGGRVRVVGTYDSRRAGPPPTLSAELKRSERFTVTQSWRAASPAGGFAPNGAQGAPEDADWIVFVSDGAVLPSGFLDDFLVKAAPLVELGVERFQPAHAGGPEAAAPVTERLLGVYAREVQGVTPLPVLAVRAGAAADGPTAIIDVAPIGLAGQPPDETDPLGYSDVLDVFVAGEAGPERGVHRSQGAPAPLISVLIATYDRPELLGEALDGFCSQTLPPTDFEVVVVDDGSPGDETSEVLERFASRLPLRWVRIEHAGRSAAKNLAVLLARGDVVVFFDDDDVPAAELLSEHVRAHELHAGEGTAVLGHTEWAPELEVSPLMHYLTEVDKVLFSYGNLDPGERYGWRCFWEGRVSSKRSLHLRHGLHDQRLAYSIDVEMAWRLMRHGLEVLYHPEARSFMARPIALDDFVRRCEAKGRAQMTMASLHSEPEIAEYTGAEDGPGRWREDRPDVEALTERARELEAGVAGARAGSDDSALAELHRAYRELRDAATLRGMAGFAEGPSRPAPRRVTMRQAADTTPAAMGDLPAERTTADPAAANGDVPILTVTMPVWSRTPQLADMAARTIERVWEVSRIPTEVVVVDNGSPVERPFRARVHRFEQNRGVASGWNAGIDLARAPVIAVLNSDCMVEPGWDEALYEAVTTGRRIAFPYTDHGDGQGFRQPDQAGTAGWCFMLTAETYHEVGPFDERFNPAYGEDTDYWHRAWELGIELTPVPDAHVTHARRTSAGDSTRADWLLTSHRYLYGWKHGVEPMSAPPYYNREIVEYERGQQAQSPEPSAREASKT